MLAHVGGSITQVQLTQATVSLNSLIRRKDKLSAYKIYTERETNTGQKSSLMTQSSKQGTHTSKLESLLFSHPNPNIWSQSSPHNPKHTTWQMYLVTSSSPDKGTTQRIFHPLSEGCSKLMSKGYSTQPKHVRTHVRTQSYHYI